MKASWEKIEKNQGVLDIEVDAEQVNDALDKAFAKVIKKVNVPGFRKGKVPRQIFEMRFGVESLYQDALDILLPEAYLEAVKETGIEPVDRPEVDIDEIEKGQPLKFKATVTVKPEVQLGEYKGIEVPEQEAVVSAEELEAELKRLQERHAELVVLEGEAAQIGDTTIIDFEGFIDGVAFDGGKGENHSLELGSGSFIPGFEEQVVGMKKGDQADIEVNFPEDYHAEELKGKLAVFKVAINEIKRKNLPALDDEFAKDASEFDTLDEFKEDLEKKLVESKAVEIKQVKEATIVDKAVEACEVEIPTAMIDAEVDEMLHEFEHRLQSQGMNLDLYYQFSGQDANALKGQMKEEAEKRVLNRLVLEAISKAEDINVSDEELEEELNKLAESVQLTPEALRQRLVADGRLSSLESDITIRKTVQFLVENSKTTTDAA